MFGKLLDDFMSGCRKFDTNILCTTDLGRDVEILRSYPLGTDASRRVVKVLLMAAMHGDEPEGVYLMDQFLNSKAIDRLSSNVDLMVIPKLNPDGFAMSTRVNARKVDLNRNFPTRDWSHEARAERYHPGPGPGSETETQALMKYLENQKPDFVVNFHSWTPMVNFNGDCLDLAQLMSRMNGCPVQADMGYPTPGSAGTWFWEALKIPSITLEIQEGWSREQVEASSHLQALVAVIDAVALKYG